MGQVCMQNGGQDACLFNSFGAPGDLPAAGDWNGSGTDKVGVFRNGTWFLDFNGNGQWDGCMQNGGQDACVYLTASVPLATARSRRPEWQRHRQSRCFP
ncbi:MAG: hypothetical protein R3F37_19245 [Candidatus Competibacteraceae bacterium]